MFLFAEGLALLIKAFAIACGKILRSENVPIMGMPLRRSLNHLDTDNGFQYSVSIPTGRD